MELLERYLQAVKKYLPWQRQDDILAELRANLESQLEDQEAEIGRPLNEGEVEGWLKQLGSPIQMAGRYQPQQYLIGPTVFPTYWYVMRIAAFWTLVAYTIMSAVLIFSAQTPSLKLVIQSALRVPGVLMVTAAWVTLVFAAIELAITHFPEKWPTTAGFPSDWVPANLPELDRDGGPGKKPRSLAMAVAEAVIGFLFLCWLLLVPSHPVLMFGPAVEYMRLSPFQLEPVWYQCYWWVVGLNVLQVGWECVDLLRRSWQGSRVAQRVTTKLLVLVPVGMLLETPGHLLVTLKNPAVDQARYSQTLHLTNEGIHRAVLVVCAIMVVQILWEIGQASVAAYRKRVATAR